MLGLTVSLMESQFVTRFWQKLHFFLSTFDYI
jgi:hypothetical protein